MAMRSSILEHPMFKKLVGLQTTNSKESKKPKQVYAAINMTNTDTTANFGLTNNFGNHVVFFW